jgi:hypothetical protein
MLAAVESHPDIPVVLHQDHGVSPAVCQQLIRSGFTSVMMDGSLREDGKTPAVLRLQRRRDPARVRDGACGRVSASKASWAAWVRWRPARRAKKTASAPKASSRTR